MQENTEVQPITTSITDPVFNVGHQNTQVAVVFGSPIQVEFLSNNSRR